MAPGVGSLAEDKPDTTLAFYCIDPFPQTHQVAFIFLFFIFYQGIIDNNRARARDNKNEKINK